MSDELPEGWAEAVLGHGLALDVQPGFACGSHNRDAQGIPHLRPMNVSENGRIDLSNLKFVAKDEVHRDERLLRYGDVLFNNTNSPELVGKTACYDLPEPRAFSNHMTRVRCHPKALDPHFCALVLHSKWMDGYFASICNNHVSQASISRAVLFQTPVALPPLAEQQRIVAKVEALLAHVNAARQRLSKVPAILKRIRQSVLAAACSGRLTADWRSVNSGVPSARKLFEQIKLHRHQRYQEQVALALREGKRKPRNQANNQNSDLPVRELEDLPESWLCVRLNDLTHLITDGTHRTPQYQESGVPFLSVKNVRPFDIKDDEIKRISEKEHQEINARCNPEIGDILYTKVGATYGYAAVNRLQYDFSLFVSVALIKPVQEFFIPDYAAIALNSEVVFDQAKERVSGSGVPDLHLIEIRDFAIPLPPLLEQHEIVRRVGALFRLADAIEKRVAAATARAEKMTQAILAKAFRGELVPTEAELSRREGRDYEPASALLARIRAERTGRNDAGKRQSTKRRLGQRGKPGR